MLLLPTDTPPADAATLTSLVQQSLQKFLTLPNSATPAATFQGTWPAHERFTLDVRGAAFDVHRRPEVAVSQNVAFEAFTASQFELLGQGMQGLNGTLDLEMHAKDVQFDYTKHTAGQVILQLGAARDGEVRLHATRAALESMIKTALQEIAGGQGVTVEAVELQLRAESATALAVQATVTATKKVGFFAPSGTIIVRGRATLDERMTLRLSDLHAEGQGGLGALAAPMLTPYLKKAEGQEVPLLAFSLGAAKLRGVRVSGGEALELQAQFGVAEPA